jgi:orotidine-5'-phosphate decarboxylase
MVGFLEKLESAILANQTLLCVGLDPVPEKTHGYSIYEFNRAIIDATQDLVCAYKPNLAFYEAQGIDGLRDLEKTLAYIPDAIPVIGDGKRGDVGSTAEAYARALFEVWGFDAITVNPYGGRDAIEPFTAYSDKGIFVWCRSSNPSAGELQDLLSELPPQIGQRSLDQDGQLLSESGSPQYAHPLYEWVARKTLSWNENGNLGLVVGATYPQELADLRRLCPDIPFLIPGIGTQGGDLELSVKGGINSRGMGAIFNVSRQVLYASSDARVFADFARQAAEKFQFQVADVLRQLGVSWVAN